MTAAGQKKRAALEHLFRDNAIDITQCRHVAVDLQHAYCADPVTAAVADTIIGGIAPRLKKLGIDTYLYELLVKHLVKMAENKELQRFCSVIAGPPGRKKNKSIVIIHDGWLELWQ